MTKYISLAWNWLVWSSADPTARSLTVKAGLTALLTYGTMIAGLAHVSLPSDLITEFIDAVVAVVQSVLVAASSVIAAWALLRKIIRTIDGTNHALNG
ncbi:hypothetical protein ACVWZV_002200 [Bradyrhizobium sp. GM5.1]